MFNFKKSHALCFLSLCTLSLHAPALYAANASNNLKIGTAKIDITPQDLAGLTNLYQHQFTGVHDPIYARALWIDNGKNKAAIVSVDLVEVGDTTSLRQDIQKKLGIPYENIMIAPSHDHHAPRMGSVTPGALAHGTSPAVDRYTRFASEKIMQALEQAKTNEQPAQMGVGTGAVDVNVNRDEYTPKGWKLGYNPEGPSDKAVRVIKFSDMQDHPLAILMNYAVHSTVLDPNSTKLSGELAGVAARYVEDAYDQKPVALWTLGAVGDQAPRISASVDETALPNIKTKLPGYDAMVAQGTMVGAEAVRVANNIQTMDRHVNVQARESVFTCAIKKGVDQMSDMKQDNVKTMNIHLDVLRFNDIALAGVGGEVVTNIWRHLQRETPLANTILVSMANDRIGYIADDAAFETSKFEVKGTPVVGGCAENGIVHGLTHMIQQTSR